MCCCPRPSSSLLECLGVEDADRTAWLHTACQACERARQQLALFRRLRCAAPRRVTFCLLQLWFSSPSDTSTSSVGSSALCTL
mmetsp:Transcript_55759/g.110696  ORF Transcript_55759/g.110696 Transcript_55759/m.110696 type:complete len:83 (-) Transcript_55759:245-493(-)